MSDNCKFQRDFYNRFTGNQFMTSMGVTKQLFNGPTSDFANINPGVGNIQHDFLAMMNPANSSCNSFTQYARTSVGSGVGNSATDTCGQQCPMSGVGH